MDLSNLAGWDATSAFFQYHVQHGSKSINNYAGSFAGVDNIESNTNAGHFFQVWPQKNQPTIDCRCWQGCMRSILNFILLTSPGCFSNRLMACRRKWGRPGRMAHRLFRWAHWLCVPNTPHPIYPQEALSDGVPAIHTTRKAPMSGWTRMTARCPSSSLIATHR